MSDKSYAEGVRLGEFFVSKRNGEACYELMIDTPPGVRGIQPNLSVCYRSLTKRPSTNIGEGWFLDGLAELTRSTHLKFQQDGRNVNAVEGRSDTFLQPGLDGGTRTYVVGKNKNIALLRSVSDVFGNEMLVEYDNEDRPTNISYGSKVLKNRAVLFSYDGESGLLLQIETQVAGSRVLTYRMSYANGLLQMMQASSRDPNDELHDVFRRPVQFKYESVAGINLLSEISETSGLKYQVDYSDKTRTVEKYQVKVAGPFHKVNCYEYLVCGRNLIHPLKDEPFYENLILWDCEQKIGSYWQYKAAGKNRGTLSGEGSFGQSDDNYDVTSKTFSQAFSAIDDSPFHKISEIEYEYVRHKTSNDALKSSEISTSYVNSGEALPSLLTRYEYNADGLLVHLQGPQTSAVREYTTGQGRGDPKLLKRSSLYDISKKDNDQPGRLIKDDWFDYEFDDLTGCPIKLSHQTLIEEGVYSAPTTSELSSEGLPFRVMAPDGMVTISSYDVFGYCTKETMISADGGHTESQDLKREPLFGNLVYTKSVEGAICRQYQNSFGELTSVSGFDPSQPKSWADDDGIVPLYHTETRFDPDFGCLVTIQSQKQDIAEPFFQKRTVLDSLSRPIIQLDQVDRGIWSIKLTKYDSEHRAVSQSLPMKIRTSSKNLANAVRKFKNNKTQWIHYLHDSFGRHCGTVFPDGSKEMTAYELSSEKKTVTTRMLFSPDGKKGASGEEHMNNQGEISFVRKGDEKPTHFRYDVEGNLIRKTDPSGQVTKYAWNAMGRCVFEKNPVTGEQSARYGKTLKLEEETRNDIRIVYRYDWRGRPVEKRVNSGAASSKTYRLKYHADPENRSYSVCATHPDGWENRIRMAPSGQEIERTVKLGPTYSETIRTDLHPGGNIHVRRFPDGRCLEYGYHASGWTRFLSWQDEKAALVMLEGHDSFGRPEKICFANGVTEKRSFSNRGNMKKFTIEKRHHNSAKNLLTQEFKHLPGYMGMVENIIQKNGQDKAEANRFTYGSCGRLLSVANNLGQVEEQFEYGIAGNIDRYQRTGRTYQKFLAENHDRQTVDMADNSFQLSLRHNKSGQLLSAMQPTADWSFLFGEEGDLEQVQKKSNAEELSVQVVTDAIGRRLIRSDSTGTTTIFVAEDYQLTRTCDGKVLSTVKFVTEHGCLGESIRLLDSDAKIEPLFGDVESKSTSIIRRKKNSQISEQRKPGTLFLHLDHRGSTLMATDQNGDSEARVSFDSYGNIDSGKSSGCCYFDIVFAGMILDSQTGLYYAKARYYSAEFLGFLSPDPARSSSDLYGYPNDPINSFDYNGACRMDNFWQHFLANYGRETTVFGSGVLTAYTSIGLFMFWDLAVFGYPFDAAVRWSLAVAFWFVQLVVFPGIFGICNENRRIRCGRERRRPVGADEIGKLGSDVIRVLISTTIGVVWMGPLLSFIGSDECEGWQLFNCPFDFYRMNLIRGAVTCTTSSIAGILVGRMMDQCQCKSNSLAMKYISGIFTRVIGSVSWQGSDFALLYFAYGRPAQETLAGKIPFFVGMVSMSVFMSQPNFLWGLLPAIYNAPCLSRSWALLFKPRSVFSASHPRAGELVPFFPGRSSRDLSNNIEQEVSRISLTEIEADQQLPDLAIEMEDHQSNIVVIETDSDDEADEKSD